MDVRRMLLFMVEQVCLPTAELWAMQNTDIQCAVGRRETKGQKSILMFFIFVLRLHLHHMEFLRARDRTHTEAATYSTAAVNTGFLTQCTTKECPRIFWFKFFLSCHKYEFYVTHLVNVPYPVSLSIQASEGSNCGMLCSFPFGSHCALPV